MVEFLSVFLCVRKPKQFIAAFKFRFAKGLSCGYALTVLQMLIL